MIPTLHFRWFCDPAPILQQWHNEARMDDYKGDCVKDSPTGEPGRWIGVPVVFGD